MLRCRPPRQTKCQTWNGCDQGRRAEGNKRAGASYSNGTCSSPSQARSPKRAGTSCSTPLVRPHDTSWNAAAIRARYAP